MENSCGSSKGHSSDVTGVAFSPDSLTVASASGDGTVRIRNIETGRSIMTLKGHTGEVRSVAFSPDGKRLATGGTDKTIRVWETIDE
jgi:WD40 repeat protein